MIIVSVFSKNIDVYDQLETHLIIDDEVEITKFYFTFFDLF